MDHGETRIRRSIYSAQTRAFMQADINKRKRARARTCRASVPVGAIPEHGEFRSGTPNYYTISIHETMFQDANKCHIKHIFTINQSLLCFIPGFIRSKGESEYQSLPKTKTPSTINPPTTLQFHHKPSNNPPIPP